MKSNEERAEIETLKYAASDIRDVLQCGPGLDDKGKLAAIDLLSSKLDTGLFNLLKRKYWVKEILDEE